MRFNPAFDSLALKGVDPGSLSARGVYDWNSQLKIAPGRPSGRRKWEKFLRNPYIWDNNLD